MDSHQCSHRCIYVVVSVYICVYSSDENKGSKSNEVESSFESLKVRIHQGLLNIDLNLNDSQNLYFSKMLLVHEMRHQM